MVQKKFRLHTDSCGHGQIDGKWSLTVTQTWRDLSQLLAFWQCEPRHAHLWRSRISLYSAEVTPQMVHRYATLLLERHYGKKEYTLSQKEQWKGREFLPVLLQMHDF